MIKEKQALPGYHVIGKSPQRMEGWEKVTGKIRYTDDLKLPGMLCAKVFRSNYAHAEIIDIDISAALEIPGVVAVLTAKDIPGHNGVGIIVRDEPVLVSERIRRVGDPLALVAAESAGAAAAAISAIKVNLRVLPAVFSPQDAMAAGAPLLREKSNVLMHRKIRKGNLEEALAQAHIVIENIFITPFVEHAAMEPETSIAHRDGNDITVWTSTQNPHFDRGEVAVMLGLDQNRVRIVQQATGGGFGGKLDISTQCHAALLAWHSNRPVKLTYTREESFVTSSKRHPFSIKYLTAADREGKLLGVMVKIVADTGAYASYGPAVVTRAALHATGPYYVPHVHVDAYAVYTNNPYCGAMRGFGVPQVGFAHEVQMDMLGERLGLDSWEIRRRNFLFPGMDTATGQILRQSVGIGETMKRVWEKVIGS